MRSAIALEVHLSRKNARTQRGLLPDPAGGPTTTPPPPDPGPVDLGGGVEVKGYGLRTTPGAEPWLEWRNFSLPLATLFDLGIGRAGKKQLTLAEAAERPLVKVGPGLWLERATSFMLVREGEMAVGDLLLRVCERLAVTAQGSWLLPLDGRPRRIERDEAIERFAEARVDFFPRQPHLYWPPPVPPVAVVVPSDDELDTIKDAALSSLITRPHVVGLSFIACVDAAALADAVVVKSTAVYQHLMDRTHDGVFHPHRAPERTKPSHHARIVFGLDRGLWSTVAHLYKAGIW